jgi:uncharacterized protein YbjT (DUF2867 family)
VTLLVRPGAEDRLGPLADRTRWWTADVWDSASLKGRARGHSSVVHTVGSMTADPARGLSYHQLNFISARNVANMCISGGVAHMVLMSSPRAPWVNSGYLRAKREAEAYLERVGLRATIIRAPLAYLRGAPRSPFYQLMSVLGVVPPFAWLGFGRIAPIPVDVLARGVASITLEERQTRTVYYAPDLRRRGRQEDAITPLFDPDDTQPVRPTPFRYVDENTPFGWTPPGDE